MYNVSKKFCEKETDVNSQYAWTVKLKCVNYAPEIINEK